MGLMVDAVSILFPGSKTAFLGLRAALGLADGGGLPGVGERLLADGGGLPGVGERLLADGFGVACRLGVAQARYTPRYARLGPRSDSPTGVGSLGLVSACSPTGLVWLAGLA